MSGAAAIVGVAAVSLPVGRGAAQPVRWYSFAGGAVAPPVVMSEHIFVYGRRRPAPPAAAPPAFRLGPFAITVTTRPPNPHREGLSVLAAAPTGIPGLDITLGAFGGRAQVAANATAEDVVVLAGLRLRF